MRDKYKIEKGKKDSCRLQVVFLSIRINFYKTNSFHLIDQERAEEGNEFHVLSFEGEREREREREMVRERAEFKRRVNHD